MSLALQALDWDSRFFGIRIGRLSGTPASAADLAAPLATARAENYDCLYASVPADALDAGLLLERAGFVARDVRLEFGRAVAGAPPVDGVRTWSQEDLPVLEQIAETAFANTRFAADPHFPRERVRELYRTWIRNSCQGFADAVLVAGPAHEPQGFVTLHLEKATADARIGLIGIAGAHRGQGVGSRLVSAAIHWTSGQGCTRILVATQAINVGAQRLYQRAGFTTVAASTWYHAWPRSELTKEHRT